MTIFDNVVDKISDGLPDEQSKEFFRKSAKYIISYGTFTLSVLIMMAFAMLAKNKLGMDTTIISLFVGMIALLTRILQELARMNSNTITEKDVQEYLARQK